MDSGLGSETDASAVELFLAPGSAGLRPVKEMVLLAPVEVRCPGPHPEDPDDPCNREYALEHSELKAVAQFSHFPCGTRPQDFLQREIGDGSRQENHCDLRMSKDAIALGVVGHMHLRGRSITIELNPDGEDAQTLLHIPDWNFDWQGQYWYQQPVPVQRGDTLRITCVYDNSGPIEGPDHSTLQPRYMTWGEGTKDEMCIGAMNYLEPEG